MCTGAVRPPVYRTVLHKDREKLLEMPQSEEEWHQRRALVLRALGKAE